MKANGHPTLAPDRNMALSFGALVLALILALILLGSMYYTRVIMSEENRLLKVLSGVVGEAVNRVSFSGKYHSQLLIEELARDPAIAFIVILDSDNREIASTGDFKRKHAAIDVRAINEVLSGGATAMVLADHMQDHVREAILPFRVGYDNHIAGTIHVGVDFSDQDQQMLRGMVVMIMVSVGLALLSMLVVYRLSARFSAPVKEMAGKLAGILDFVPLIVIIRDAKGVVKDASASFNVLMPGQTNAFAGPSGCDVEVASANSVVRCEEVVRLENGDHSFAVVKFPIMLDKNARPSLICTVAADVTEQRRAEADLRQRTQQLERINSELEQFAYVASHDLQEPLRMVASYVQLIERRYKDKLDKDGQEFINFASEGAVRMQKQILDLLEFSRVGRMSAPFERIEMHVPLHQALDYLRLSIEESGALIQVPEKLPVVVGAGPDLVRLWQNLLSNAIKYRHAERPVRIGISVRRDGDFWEFAVSDNGIGIAPEYGDRVFLIFQRLHSRSEYPGNGIGLALCRKIVEHHGGHIWLRQQEEGVCFVFTLPVAEE